MKTKHFLILAAKAFMASGSPEERSIEQIDTNAIKNEETAGRIPSRT
jgi:hypothetical protein